MAQNVRQTDQLLRAIADAQSMAERAEINRLVTAYVQTVEPCLQKPLSKAPPFVKWLDGAMMAVAISLLLGIGALALYWLQPSDAPSAVALPAVPSMSPTRMADARAALPTVHETPRATRAAMPRSAEAHTVSTRSAAAALAPPRQRRRATTQRLRAPLNRAGEPQLHPPKLEISDDCKNRPLAANCAQ